MDVRQSENSYEGRCKRNGVYSTARLGGWGERVLAEHRGSGERKEKKRGKGRENL